MVKTVSLRLDGGRYDLFRKLAEDENRTLSNFIETTVLRYIQEHEDADEFEMSEIRKNAALNQSLRRGIKDAQNRKGSFIG